MSRLPRCPLNGLALCVCRSLLRKTVLVFIGTPAAFATNLCARPRSLSRHRPNSGD